MKGIHILGLFIFLLVSGNLSAAESTPRFQVTVRKSDDAVTITGDQKQTVFTVTSASGIGSTVIERRDEGWPGSLVLRLRLKGLESLKINNGTESLGVAVTLRGQRTVTRQWKGEQEIELAGDDPLRVSVSVLGADGKPAKALPVKDGTIEVTLPAAFFQGNPKRISVDWVDFFR